MTDLERSATSRLVTLLFLSDVEPSLDRFPSVPNAIVGAWAELSSPSPRVAALVTHQILETYRAPSVS